MVILGYTTNDLLSLSLSTAERRKAVGACRFEIRIMRILLCTFTFPPNKDGVSEAASAMAQAFLDRGWSVEIATEPVNPKREDLNWNGATIHEFSIIGSLHPRNPFRGEVGKYRSLLLSGNWDVIIFHSYSWTLYLAAPILDLLPGKKISASHGYGALVWVPVPRFPYGIGGLAITAIHSLLMLRWIKKIDRLVFLSKQRDLLAFYDHTLAHIARHKGIEIIPNGIDLDEKPSDPESFRNQIGADAGSIVFLCVANYSKRKNQGFAARAFRKAAISDSFLVFIGSEFNEFTEEFRKADLPFANAETPGRVVWVEKQSREATVNAIAGCDIFVLSASQEAQPIVLLEAMRERKPWIARDAGCISEMPGGICVKTVASMAAAMKKLAADPGLCDILGSEGRRAVEQIYNRSAYNSAYCRLIEQISFVH